MSTATEIVDQVEQDVEDLAHGGSPNEATDPEQVDTNEATAEATPAPKPTKVVKQPHACYCSTYEVVDPEDTKDGIFSTGCDSTTKSVFAQGHDARLVSFLVDGYFDGYKIRQVQGETTVEHDTPADAVKHVSEPLAEKANKATLNRKAKLSAVADRKAAREKLAEERKANKAKADAEKAAAKAKEKADKAAAAPKATGAEVVAGSTTGDLPELEDGQARIKVGKFEYVAAIDDEGNATYTDGAGDEQVVNRDGYRLLAV